MSIRELGCILDVRQDQRSRETAEALDAIQQGRATATGIIGLYSIPGERLPRVLVDGEWRKLQ